MNRVSRRSVTVLVLVALLLAGFLFFLIEFFIQSPSWAVSSYSPHVVSKLDNGAVTDRDGILLLDMEGSWTYSTSESIRKSTLHWVGDRLRNIQVPAVPNYYGELVSYDMWNGMYTFGGAENSQGVITLTVSSQLQTVALEALENRKGTVAVYNYKTGEILCAVTTPTYDPDHVPDIEGDLEQYEGAYMNRFVQSAYTPGSIFKIVTLAAALDTLPDAQSMTFTCTGSWGGGEYPVTCESVHGKQTLQQAFCNSCNCAFAELAVKIGGEKMEAYVKQFGVNQVISFDGIETAEGNYQADGAADIDVGWSGVGQFNDQINPCAFLSFVGAVAGGGEGSVPCVVENVKVGNNRTYTARPGTNDAGISDKTARTIAEFMRNNVENKYGDSYFPGLTVCAKTGTAEVGGEKRPNAMLAGFVADGNYPLAFIVCVEDGGYGAEVCLPIASQVLSACVESMNSNG